MYIRVVVVIRWIFLDTVIALLNNTMLASLPTKMMG